MPYSKECLEVLTALKEEKNVLIFGAPASGKTRLLSEVADAFLNGFVNVAAPPPKPTMVTGTRVPIPASAPDHAGVQPIPELPSPSRAKREVFRTSFNASTKPRDFLSGWVPVVSSGGGSVGFRVQQGVLPSANSWALENGGAALLIIDELNRGPAVQLFGSALVSMEADKRLDETDQKQPNSWPLTLLNGKGDPEEVFLSGHLYILAAMNQADVSVDQLDSAFIRRWRRYPLGPNENVARTELNAAGAGVQLSDPATTPSEVVEALVRAWVSVNKQLCIARGEEYQIGHGPLVAHGKPADLPAAFRRAHLAWDTIIAHLDEVLFGDSFAMAAVLKADPQRPFYQLELKQFGQDQRAVLKRPNLSTDADFYAMLLHVGQ